MNLATNSLYLKPSLVKRGLDWFTTHEPILGPTYNTPMKKQYFFNTQKSVSIYRAGYTTSITLTAGGFLAVHHTGNTFIHISSQPDLARTQGK